MQTPVTGAFSAVRFLMKVVSVLSLAGAIVSGVSLERHYATSATTFCDFSEKFNCDIVNRSEYSTVAGIPVAGIGIAGYIALFVLSTFRKSRPETPNWMLGASVAGLAFALYLTYIEAYVLTTWCALCLASLALISLICAFSSVIRVKTPRA
jgi:vitamin-K-epoxide reductase (warfarin-sensitive)